MATNRFSQRLRERTHQRYPPPKIVFSPTDVAYAYSFYRQCKTGPERVSALILRLNEVFRGSPVRFRLLTDNGMYERKGRLWGFLFEKKCLRWMVTCPTGNSQERLECHIWWQRNCLAECLVDGGPPPIYPTKLPTVEIEFGGRFFNIKDLVPGDAKRLNGRFFTHWMCYLVRLYVNGGRGFNNTSMEVFHDMIAFCKWAQEQGQTRFNTTHARPLIPRSVVAEQKCRSTTVIVVVSDNPRSTTPPSTPPSLHNYPPPLQERRPQGRPRHYARYDKQQRKRLRGLECEEMVEDTGIEGPEVALSEWLPAEWLLQCTPSEQCGWCVGDIERRHFRGDDPPICLLEDE